MHPSARGNHLLAALRVAEYARLLPHLEWVDLARGDVLGEPGGKIIYVHFPVSTIVSLLCTLGNGDSLETALVGREGLINVPLFLGAENQLGRAVVQSAGGAYRISATAVKAEFALGGTLQAMALRYTWALMIQLAQTAVCNRHHRLEQQLCRCLMSSLDRCSGDELHMTQELIAGMLGVRREGITMAAGTLQALGIIRWNRGRIRVLDRQRLECRTCECYAVLKGEYQRLLPAHDRRLIPAAVLTAA